MIEVAPSVLVVMGVSGSGKTTVAALLAGRLGWEYGDADDFHSPANVRKMHGGTPLTDEDRWPLAPHHGRLDRRHPAPSAATACSPARPSAAHTATS